MTVIFPIHDTDKKHIWFIKSERPHAVDYIKTITNVNFEAYNKKYIRLSFDTTVLVYLLCEAVYENYPTNTVGLIKLESPEMSNTL